MVGRSYISLNLLGHAEVTVKKGLKRDPANVELLQLLKEVGVILICCEYTRSVNKYFNVIVQRLLVLTVIIFGATDS